MRFRSFGTVVLFMVTLASASIAQVAIAPGSERTLTLNDATGGSAVDNGNVTFDLGSAFDLGAKTIKAQVSGGLSVGTGESSAQIFYDFDVPASPANSGNSVGAWVSYSTQWQGFQIILASLSSNSSVEVDMVLRDITDLRNLHVEPIHSLDLKTYKYKVITAGVDLDDSGSKANTFPAVLRRGHSYRITLRASCTVMILAPTATPSICDYMDGFEGGGNGRVQLNSLYVKVGLDEKEVLEKLGGFQNHRHIYLTGQGVGHNNTQALSSLPTAETKGSTLSSPPLAANPVAEPAADMESPPQR